MSLHIYLLLEVRTLTRFWEAISQIQIPRETRGLERRRVQDRYGLFATMPWCQYSRSRPRQLAFERSSHLRCLIRDTKHVIHRSHAWASPENIHLNPRRVWSLVIFSSITKTSELSWLASEPRSIIDAGLSSKRHQSAFGSYSTKYSGGIEMRSKSYWHSWEMTSRMRGFTLIFRCKYGTVSLSLHTSIFAHTSGDRYTTFGRKPKGSVPNWKSREETDSRKHINRTGAVCKDYFKSNSPLVLDSATNWREDLRNYVATLGSNRSL